MNLVVHPVITTKHRYQRLSSFGQVVAERMLKTFGQCLLAGLCATIALQNQSLTNKILFALALAFVASLLSALSTQASEWLHARHSR